MADGKRAVDSAKVWTTLVTNMAYLPGLLTLDYSLKKQKSAYPLVALYTDGFPAEGIAALEARGIPHQRINYLLPKTTKDYSNDPRFYDCWTKLSCFGFTQYDRVVQLDSDMLVLQNMDELMTIHLDDPAVAAEGGPDSKRVFAASHACACNPLNKPHYPKNFVPENCAFTSQHSDPDTAQTVGADPTVGPVRMMNGGLMVVNPSDAIFQQIAHFMDENAPAMEFADQSVLSELYSGRWVALPYVYNALKTIRWEGVHRPIWRDDKVKNIHYILTPNPWDDLDDEGNSTGKDETHQWWAEVNKERKADESNRGVNGDGF
ncbi:Galactinol synthase 1 [Cytospora mali]|uniref:Galactinol synthase 1 n=1 Tax=Cytospora mali TaxID=578113 RepID=A0A194W8R7_CYTMA|nr:Galactinol synthase 1 [Valsa mali]